MLCLQLSIYKKHPESDGSNSSLLPLQVAAANAEQIARKKMLAEQEHEEEMRIADYLRQKDAREQVGCLLQDVLLSHQESLAFYYFSLPAWHI